MKKAQLLFKAKAILGEGPVWDWRKKRLYWVDIEGCSLHSHHPDTGENQHWSFDEMLGAAVPTESGKILLAFESGLTSFNLERNEITPQHVLENNDPKMRYNDGKVGPNGSLWVGSMHKQFKARTGNLYLVTSDFETRIQISDTTISNGMAWSSNGKKFYFIDSPTHQICSYDHDLKTSQIRNKEVVISIPKKDGAPDGMCIDEENMLWVAHWGGSCVRRWNPNTGKILEIIEVPAPHVTSCCFGGEDLKTLYITTARSGLIEEQLKKLPLSGGLFKYQSKVAGKKITYFKD